MLTNDWAVFDIMIVASGDRVVITTHQNLKMLKSWGAQHKRGTNGNVGSALKTTHAKTTGNHIPYLYILATYLHYMALEEYISLNSQKFSLCIRLPSLILEQ